MQLPQWLARFNRHLTNRFWRLLAGWIPAHGLLEHVGRRSGKPYRTPLMVFNADVDGQPVVAIVLSYGPDRDWLKNLKAAGTGRMRRHGKSIGVADPRVVTRAEAAQHVSKGWRPIISRVPFEQAVLLTRTG
jgi:deazaflavin-dependent oxidoreductase (nitroreductase family)